MFSNKARAGFSVLKLLTLVVITGFLITIVLPKMSDVIRNERANHATQIGTLMQ